MELEIHLKGKLLDSIPIKPSQLEKLEELQHKLDKKYHREIEESGALPKYFICGMPAKLATKIKGAK